MIYCVIPPELADELYDKLVKHYSTNANVQVIIDRRTADRRAGEKLAGVPEEIAQRRETRDRRRARPGSFPEVHSPAAEG
ncbi:MAG: hypothetical protein H7123_06560 [Thermoleophilia bacterium]|nr:hypothetical protein [Thermoleophilia bacterium]